MLRKWILFVLRVLMVIAGTLVALAGSAALLLTRVKPGTRGYEYFAAFLAFGLLCVGVFEGWKDIAKGIDRDEQVDG